jgi:hypothetical protein
MLLTTADGHVHVLDSFRGTLVCIFPTFVILITSYNCYIFALKDYLWFFSFIMCTQLSTYNVTPVSSNATLEASFSPDGMFVISSKSFWITQNFSSNYALINSLIIFTVFFIALVFCTWIIELLRLQVTPVFQALDYVLKENFTINMIIFQNFCFTSNIFNLSPIMHVILLASVHFLPGLLS